MQGHTTHDFTEAEAVKLIEGLSVEDWEDGGRCCREIVDGVGDIDGPFDPDDDTYWRRWPAVWVPYE